MQQNSVDRGVLACQRFEVDVSQRHQISVPFVMAGLCVLAGASSISGWSFDGHRAITLAAIASLPPSVPFDRDDLVYAVEGSVFPDLSRPISLPQLREREKPQHYINIELLLGRNLPADRSGYLGLLAELAGSPDRLLGVDESLESVGLLPYAVIEASQELAAVFRQLRSKPGDPRLQYLAQHYAGILSHYAGDLCQPLHTTIHHDGRANDRGVSSQSGIHDLVDRLLARYGAVPTRVSEGVVEISTWTDVWQGVMSELAASHSLVEDLYELESEIRQASASGDVSPQLQSFVDTRFSASVGFAAQLMYSAWQLSASVQLP